jgi:ribosomal-protein-alanine N-acetyltransferase
MNTISLSSTGTTLIRPMGIEDLDHVLDIENLSFSLPWPVSAYQYELNQNPLSLLWVAETDLFNDQPKIVGMIVVWLIVDEAHIATLAVHPEQHHKGFARSLLTTALIETIHRGMRVATLEVRASNLAAQHLYLGFRFKIAGRRPRYYRDNNEDALIMTITELDETYLSWLENNHRICRQGDELCIPKRN